jgi:acetyltransferase
VLSERDGKAILAHFGIPTTREVLVAPGADLAKLCKDLKPPFAVKIVSADIAHKSDIGGVQLNVPDLQAAAVAARDVTANAKRAAPKAKLDGVLVAEMAKGIELIVGVINDPAFGPCVALGMGGVLTEVLKDVTYRVAPFDQAEAQRMISELKAQKLLDGYRGQPGIDRAALAKFLVRVSTLAMTLNDRLDELDINPVFAGPQGLVAADALLVLK